MKEKNKIECIIFDIGNVLLTFNPQELLTQATNRKDRIKAFLHKIILSETWLKMDKGLLTLEKGEKAFRLQFPEIDDLIEFFFQHWRSVFKPISENILVAHLLKQKAY
ncbi:MAG: hypothetical protein GF383_00290, partial [Candidatus Lokiarchaeota archaeon]|nr:hypothetical protein [Candidatus Lokiarchaeota archaeon]MBD3337549.1 hypothetical protein [Candidatus Lokiarchaeota archaeon]